VTSIVDMVAAELPEPQVYWQAASPELRDVEHSELPLMIAACVFSAAGLAFSRNAVRTVCPPTHASM
jgi:hypothetical protein